MNDQFQMMWKKAVIVQFYLLSRKVCGGTEEELSMIVCSSRASNRASLEYKLEGLRLEPTRSPKSYRITEEEVVLSSQKLRVCRLGLCKYTR
jgi:hypothetical protein